MSKILVEPERPQTIWRMRIACWISKIRLLARKHTPAPVHTHTRTTRARAHAHT